MLEELVNVWCFGQRNGVVFLFLEQAKAVKDYQEDALHTATMAIFLFQVFARLKNCEGIPVSMDRSEALAMLNDHLSNSQNRDLDILPRVPSYEQKMLTEARATVYTDISSAVRFAEASEPVLNSGDLQLLREARRREWGYNGVVASVGLGMLGAVTASPLLATTSLLPFALSSLLYVHNESVLPPSDGFEEFATYVGARTSFPDVGYAYLHPATAGYMRAANRVLSLTSNQSVSTLVQEEMEAVMNIDRQRDPIWDALVAERRPFVDQYRSLVRHVSPPLVLQPE